jgi:hypothetical protein
MKYIVELTERQPRHYQIILEADSTIEARTAAETIAKRDMGARGLLCFDITEADWWTTEEEVYYGNAKTK